MEPMALGFNGDIPKAMDRTPPGALTTTGAGGPTGVVAANTAKSGACINRGTGGVDLG